jgi:branched-chain amino acid:cation transporter, LIVCS family
MTNQSTTLRTLTTGFAMFSMFFGAGNVVFPLFLGQYAQDHNTYAIIGLLITAVAMPFAGLIAMTLFDGNYREFFGRIGAVPGFILALFIMGLIGPFGALPRCIILSYSTIKIYLPAINFQLFSIFSCLLIFLFSIRRTQIIDLLGKVLTPLLLVSLGIIIIKGIVNSPAMPQAEHSKLTIFLIGMKEGYQTMDLLGAFFFSSVILACLKQGQSETDQKNYKQLMILSLQASAVGAFLLSLVYVGFSFVAAFQSQHLIDVPKDQIAGMISAQVLGPYAGVIASVAVALTCLTTAIALASVFAEFVYEDISNYKLPYGWALFLTLVITYFVSTLNFTGIASFLTPILQICYPALIALSFFNILYKIYGFKPVKIPVLVIFLASLLSWFVTKT